MTSIKKYFSTALITGLVAFTSNAIAEQLTVYGTLFESTVNVSAWEDSQPVSGGYVELKDALGRTVAEGSLNSKGRVYLYAPGLNAGQEYTVVAENGSQSGSSQLFVHDSASSRGVAAR